MVFYESCYLGPVIRCYESPTEEFGDCDERISIDYDSFGVEYSGPYGETWFGVVGYFKHGLTVVCPD